MLLTLRTLFGCIGVAGGACATTIPITIYSGSVDKSHQVGEGKTKNQLKLTKCTGESENRADSIIFGTEVTAPFCWKLQDSSDNESQEIESVDTFLTELLKREWNKTQTRFTGDTVWRPSMCVVGGNGPQWILSNSSDNDSTERGVKYIGTCITSAVPDSTVSFLEIDSSTSEGKNPTLKLCYQDCWTVIAQKDSSPGILSYQNKNTSKWRALNFIKTASN